MPRVLIEAAVATGSAVGSTTSQFAGTLFMLCMAAAVLGAVVFACGHRSKRNNQMRPNVTYYGTPGGGGGYTSYASGNKQGRAGLGTGLAVGAVAGLATAVAVDAAVSSAACGGGGCGGGGC